MLDKRRLRNRGAGWPIRAGTTGAANGRVPALAAPFGAGWVTGPDADRRGYTTTYARTCTPSGPRGILGENGKPDQRGSSAPPSRRPGAPGQAAGMGHPAQGTSEWGIR